MIKPGTTPVEENCFVTLESSRTVRRKQRQTVTDHISEQNKCHKPFRDVKCIRCKNQDLSYWYKQTQAMDEGQSTQFKCNICGVSWKLSS
jgi:DNA-directed RNA polymerase subunit M/transcription elongation factor TFIIS